MSKSTIGQVSPGAQADAVHSSVQRFRTTRLKRAGLSYRTIGRRMVPNVSGDTVMRKLSPNPPKGVVEMAEQGIRDPEERLSR